LTQTFTAHCNAMICQQVTLSGDAEWLKVADAVIEALFIAYEIGRYLGSYHATKRLDIVGHITSKKVNLTF